MRLFRFFLLGLLLAMGLATANQVQNPSGMLHFFNSPETVRQTGIIASTPVTKGERVRLFYHHRNGTRRTQTFIVEAHVELASLRYGTSKSPDPSLAGAVAMRNFVNSRPAPTPQRWRRVVPLMAGETVSGVVEGMAVTDGYLDAHLGEGGLIANSAPQVTSHIFVEHEVEVKPGERAAIRVGHKSQAQPKGDYGTTISTVFAPNIQRPARLLIDISPRGGPITFVYTLNGKPRETRRLAAKTHHRLATIDVRPGERVSIQHIPTGGFSYPVELSARVVYKSS